MSSETGTFVASASPLFVIVIWKVRVSPGLAVLVGPNEPSLVLTSLTVCEVGRRDRQDLVGAGARGRGVVGVAAVGGLPVERPGSPGRRPRREARRRRRRRASCPHRRTSCVHALSRVDGVGHRAAGVRAGAREGRLVGHRGAEQDRDLRAVEVARAQARGDVRVELVDDRGLARRRRRRRRRRRCWHRRCTRRSSGSCPDRVTVNGPEVAVPSGADRRPCW